MKKTLNILLVVVLALFAFPVNGSTANAKGNDFDNIKDGEYNITAKAMNTDGDKESGAQGFINKDAKLVIENGKVKLTLEVPNNSMAEIKKLTIEGKDPKITETNDSRLLTFTLNALNTELSAQVHYVVPSMNMDHDVPFKFVLEGLNKLPVKEDEVVEEEEVIEEQDKEKQLDTNLITNPDKAEQINYVTDSDMIKRYFSNPVKVVHKDGKKYIQIDGNSKQFIQSLKINGKEVTWSEINEDNTYTFQFEVTGSLSKKLDFGMTIDAAGRIMEHTVGLWFGDDQPIIEVGLGKKTAVTGDAILNIADGKGTQLIVPQDLPKNVAVTVTSAKDKVKNVGNLKPVGEVYDFTFENLSDEAGIFELAMKYDAKKYPQNKYDVAIYYYDETAGKWIRQDSEVKNGVVVTKVDHFSIYGVFATEIVQKEEPNKSNDNVKPDKVAEISYEILHENGKEKSLADEYFKKPALLLDKDGKKYVQFTITNGDMVKELSNKYGEALLIKDNKDGSIVVQLRVDNNLANMDLHMRIVVPAMPGFPGYNMEHGAILSFNKNSLKELSVDENKHQLGLTNKQGNENGPYDKDTGQSGTVGGDANEDNNGKQPANPGDFGSNDKNAVAEAKAGKVDNPKTGDTSQVWLYTLLLIGSLIPLVINVRRRLV